MDVALKQRLVGASVLVALGVILIPMLLEGPRNGRDQAAIPIPDQPERNFETRLLPVDPSESAAAEPEEPVPASGAREVVAVGTGPAAASPEPPAEAADAAERWVLQLGSFGNAANAARLIESLEQAGWDAYQEKVEVADHTLYRVRAGTWSSKAEAAAEGIRIAARFEDLDISLRQLDGDAEPTPANLRGWLVQVGSFAQEQNAYQLRDRLRAGGIAAHVVAVEAASGGGFKVRVGPELDRASAQRQRERLRTEFGLNGILVDHP